MSLVEIKVPDIGDFKEVEVVEILVKPGDAIAKDASLVSLESDKATMEIPSPDAGVVKELRVKIGDKVDEGLKGEIQSAIDAAKAAVEGGDPDQMNEKSQALAQVAMKLGQAIYEKQQQSEASPAGDTTAEAKKDDDVVDAEFSEVDDTKA